jgi:hypothetical protein
MALLIPTVGEGALLKAMLGEVAAADLTLKLFVNDYTPIDASVAGDLTEMSTQGYAAKTLDKDDWSYAQASGKEEASYAEQQWTFDGTGGATTVYGYFVIGYSGTLLWAERFSSARLIQNNGDILRFTPKFTFSKE